MAGVAVALPRALDVGRWTVLVCRARIARPPSVRSAGAMLLGSARAVQEQPPGAAGWCRFGQPACVATAKRGWRPKRVRHTARNEERCPARGPGTDRAMPCGTAGRLPGNDGASHWGVKRSAPNSGPDRPDADSSWQGCAGSRLGLLSTARFVRLRNGGLPQRSGHSQTRYTRGWQNDDCTNRNVRSVCTIHGSSTTRAVSVSWHTSRAGVRGRSSMMPTACCGT